MTEAARVRLVVPRICASLLVLIALVLVVGGAQLLLVGGSPYYLFAGAALALSAVLLWRGRREGIWIYAAIVVVTFAWAVWEAGWAPWALMPRVVAWLVVGSLLLLPAFRRLPVAEGGILSRLKPLGRLPGLALATLLSLAIGTALHGMREERVDPRFQAGTIAFPAPASTTSVEGGSEWRHWGGNQGGTRFSPLTQITPANVGRLERAWEASTDIAGTGDSGGNGATPLMIDGTLYTCNGANDLFAVDAETGKRLWQARAAGKHGFKCRGVAYYRSAADGLCASRILAATGIATLVAVDARTGAFCPDFGRRGVVDLTEGMPPAPKGYYRVTSAPTLIRGKAVVGGLVMDGQIWGAASGVIRAFDAVTGKLAWAWDMGAPDRVGAPPPGEHYTPGTPNSWAPMSADEQLGMVYVPMGNPSGVDYFSGLRRPFDRKFGSSVVALDAETGRVRWSFQTVHNDVWDYDVASQPVLIDLPRQGGGIDRALIQGTKQGEIFVLDRTTGQPLRKVEERPVPQGGTVPGEHLSRTQPYSVAMPSFRDPVLLERDMWGITPLDQLACRITFRKARYQGHFTPPGLDNWITLPGTTGGMNWGSPTIDPDHGVMIVNTGRIAQYTRLIPRPEADALGYRPNGDWDPSFKDAGGGPQQGSPYAVAVNFLFSPLFAPCQAPPYGYVSAIDLNSGKLIWSRPIGTARDTGPLGMATRLPLPMGTFLVGGTLATRSGLTFTAATADSTLRALDERTGRTLWEADLEHAGFATPMTYASPRSGRQFIVVSTGGSVTGGRTKSRLVAFALPAKSERQ